MNIRSRAVFLAATMMLGFGLLTTKASASTFSTLYQFCNTASCGTHPDAAVTRDPGTGILYGTTSDGGQYGVGAIYQLSPDGTYQTLYSFQNAADGSEPEAALVLDVNGNLYGTASVGGVVSGGTGKGTVFELKHNGQFKIIHTFCSIASCTDGDTPLSGLSYATQASGALYDGTSPLYGTTQHGGKNNWGEVYQVQQGSFAKMFNFCACGTLGQTDGGQPVSGVVFDSAGNLYGTTTIYGQYGGGIVYKLNAANNWSETVLYGFCKVETHIPDCNDGSDPVSNVTLDAAGNIFGTTSVGGYASPNAPNGGGVVYEIPSGGGSETVLATFCGPGPGSNLCTYGYSPSNGLGLVMDSSENLFGTTTGELNVGYGTVYELSPPTVSGQAWTPQILHKFCTGNCSDGNNPSGGLISDALNSLYGTTLKGGSADNDGTVFKETP